MPTLKKRIDFNQSEEGVEVKGILKDMELDKLYNTISSYSANQDLYPNNLIPFIDKHMDYLRTHPSIDTKHYISNLRLMTRIRK